MQQECTGAVCFCLASPLFPCLKWGPVLWSYLHAAQLLLGLIFTFWGIVKGVDETVCAYVCVGPWKKFDYQLEEFSFLAETQNGKIWKFT